MNQSKKYSYKASLKSDESDELINVYVLRPLAGVLVGLLYRTPVTPNHLTIASLVSGLVAAVLYGQATAAHAALAGLFVTLKDLLDSADGQLARARDMYSRAGRFLDSITDFVVNAAVFGSIGWTLSKASDDGIYLILALCSFVGTSLRVSYHVFYQTSFLHLQDKYRINRITEEIREEDRRGERTTLLLQTVFGALYGWQDQLMVRLDEWCRMGLDEARELSERWYSDRFGLRLSSFLGLGTELLVLMLFSVAGDLRDYLLVNVAGFNILWAGNVLYRRVLLRRKLVKSVEPV